MSQNPHAKLRSNGIDFTPTTHHDTYDYIRPEQFDLKGRAVFITGASRGCGKAAAIAYARAGASYIALAARSGMEEVEKELQAAAKEAGRAAPNVLCLRVDVTSEKSVADAAQKVESAFSRLDIIINNAGYLEKFVPIHETEADDWWKVWEVNIKGPYLITRALLPLMFKTEDSLLTVLNVSSNGAHALLGGASGYQSGKLALLRFGEFLASDYSDKGLISFGIHPGGVMTDLAKALPEAIHGFLTDQPQLSGDTMVWLTAQRREWLNGRFISCNWDMKEFLDKRSRIEEGDLLKVRMDVGLEGHEI